MKSMDEILEIALEKTGEGYEDLEVEDKYAKTKAYLAGLYGVGLSTSTKGETKPKPRKKSQVHKWISSMTHN